MKYENIDKRRIISTLGVSLAILFYLFLLPQIFARYEIPGRYGPLYSTIGIIVIPIIVGIYSWWSREIYLALIVSLCPHIFLFLYDFFVLKLLIQTWIYAGIYLSLIGVGMVLINSNKKLGTFLVIVGAILWIMRFFGG